MGQYPIQLFNGAIPVLAAKVFTFVDEVVAPTLTPTPSPSTTPTPIVTPTPKSTPIVKPSSAPTPAATPTPVPTPTITPTPATTPLQKPLKSQLTVKIYFDLGSHSVKGSNTKKLKLLAEKIAGLGKRITILVTGYAQPTPGSEATDGRLSKQRAAAVAKLLRNAGVDTKVTYVGAGRAEINAPSSRYVEIVVANS